MILQPKKGNRYVYRSINAPKDEAARTRLTQCALVPLKSLPQRPVTINSYLQSSFAQPKNMRRLREVYNKSPAVCVCQYETCDRSRGTFFGPIVCIDQSTRQSNTSIVMDRTSFCRLKKPLQNSIFSLLLPLDFKFRYATLLLYYNYVNASRINLTEF